MLVLTSPRQTSFAQFIRICRWLQLIYKDRLAPLENAPFSTPWARKRYSVAQRFRQDLRATNCYKLSETLSDEAGEAMDDTLTKAQASERITALQQQTGRG